MIPQVQNLMPFLATSLKELAVGAEEKLAVLQESGYKDEQAAKDLIVIAATSAAVATAIGSLLGMSPTAFGTLGKQVIKIVLEDYDNIVAGNTDMGVADINNSSH